MKLKFYTSFIRNTVDIIFDVTVALHGQCKLAYIYIYIYIYLYVVIKFYHSTINVKFIYNSHKIGQTRWLQNYFSFSYLIYCKLLNM